MAPPSAPGLASAGIRPPAPDVERAYGRTGEGVNVTGYRVHDREPESAIVGLAYMRLKRRWTPGPVSMGRWSGPVTYVATVWIIAETINIASPRHLNSEWYLNWGIILTSVILGIIGLAIYTRIFRNADSPGDRRRSTVAGDPAD
jgi:hypothetical protein